MKSDTPLDCVLFQLDESRTRCELWIAAGDSTERLASGYLMPFLSHLQTGQEQLATDSGLIKLQAPPCPIAQGSPWFTKRTIERFVRFVSTPDVLERVSFLEAERVKLAEASSILISESPKEASSSAVPLSASTDSCRQELENASEQVDAGTHSMDILEIETEASRRHLVNAMDARRLILEKEQRKAFVRAAAAGFSIDSLPDLMAFAECFGATRLREACLKFTELHKKLVDSVPQVEELETEVMQTGGGSQSGTEVALEQQVVKQLNTAVADEKADWSLGEEKVKNFARRRVWGPPVAEIPLQGSSEGVNGVPDSDGLEWKDGDGAFTCDSESPQKSIGSSDARESDWEDTEDNSQGTAQPIYANIIGQQEMKSAYGDGATNESNELPVEEDKQKVEQAFPVEPGSSQTEPSAVRRKGIVIIRNVKFPQNQARESPKQSDTESDKDSVESENENKLGRSGRLSVQAAISLFETRQKQESKDPAKPTSKNPENRPPRKLGERQWQVLKTDIEGQKQAAKLTSREDKSSDQFSDVNLKRGSISLESVQAACNSLRSEANSSKDQVNVQKPESKEFQEAQPVYTPRSKEASCQGGTEKSADDISKELLDRSFSCLLKINSVVQDALLSASVLQQGKKTQESAQANLDTDSRQWRSLSNVSTACLDDIFVDSRVPTTTIRRQSLCTPAEYDSKVLIDSKEPVATKGPSSSHQKGRLYDQYQEIREAKYKRESTVTKAEREAKLRAMQDVLERRKTELLGKSSKLPEKDNTLSAEQMKAIKLRNNMLMSNRKEGRPDGMKSQQSEKSGIRKPSAPSNLPRPNQKQESPIPRSSTRKVSPGPPKATPRSSGRLSSPHSKNSTGPPVSQRRVANFMNQSVISESLRTQADLRKENAKPSMGRSGYTDTAPSSRYSQSRAEHSTRKSILPLESNRVPSNVGTVDEKRLRGTLRKSTMKVPDVRENQVLAPIKIARDMAAEQSTLEKAKYESSKPKGLIGTVKPLPQASVTAPHLKSERVASSRSVSVSKSNDECIKQIVSCINKDRQEQVPRPTATDIGKPKDSKLETSDLTDDLSTRSGSTTSMGSLNITNVKAESLKEQVEITYLNKSDELYSSSEQYSVTDKNFDDDMQIDDALEKCMSGQSLLEKISPSPLTTFESSTTAGSEKFNFKPELSTSLRTGPSSQSLPHLQRSLSPTTLSGFRCDFAAVQAKESKTQLTVCKEHHQPAGYGSQKDQPKGLKRLLKFGRRSRASDSTTDSSNDDYSENRISKKNLPEESSSRSSSSGSSSVRRSLEALPKFADELSRTLFSSFRSKSTACDARSRAPPLKP